MFIHLPRVCNSEPLKNEDLLDTQAELAFSKGLVCCGGTSCGSFYAVFNVQTCSDSRFKFNVKYAVGP